MVDPLAILILLGPTLGPTGLILILVLLAILLLPIRIAIFLEENRKERKNLS